MEKWIDYDTYKFEKLYQDLLKANYYMVQHGDTTIEELLTTLHNTPELELVDSSKGKGIKQQIKECTVINTYQGVTVEIFYQWLKDIEYETEGSSL